MLQVGTVKLRQPQMLASFGELLVLPLLLASGLEVAGGGSRVALFGHSHQGIAGKHALLDAAASDGDAGRLDGVVGVLVGIVSIVLFLDVAHCAGAAELGGPEVAT